MRYIEHTNLTWSAIILVCLVTSPAKGGGRTGQADDHNRISDDYEKYTPNYEDNRFHRPFFTLDFGRELFKPPGGVALFKRKEGEPGFTGFLEPGETGLEFTLPTGAVWQPSFLIFGTYRTALQTFDDGNTKLAEWANRLDIFLELRLTGTERILVGVRPLDQDGRFTSLNFQPQFDNDWQTEFNGRITSLFIEGEFAELFPNLDKSDFMPLDVGFSVGRQPIFVQEGMLINDPSMDAVGLVRNTLLPAGTSNLRLTCLYAWDEINRGNNFAGNNIEDETAQLWGLFTQIDTKLSTINLDVAYVDSRRTGSAFYAGLSAVQRVGHINTSFRALGSFPTTGEIDPDPRAEEGQIRDRREAAQNTRGYLFFSELSWTPPHTHDLLYVNTFYGIDRFASAARDPTTGGPLGRTGILFAAVGLGRFGSALSNQADSAYGASIGYQKFLDKDHRRQLIVEFGGRKETSGESEGEAGAAARYQWALGQQTVIQIDAFAAAREHTSASYGARVEFRFMF
ncbi:MAG: hypothetical protein V3W34_11665 [Phycisphaerae bacterium]